MVAVLFAAVLFGSSVGDQVIVPDIGPVVVTVGADRGPAIQVTPTDPPPPQIYAPEGLSNCEEASWYRQRAGLPAAFDRLTWRESNCRNSESVHTFCCWGYLQLYVSLHLRDGRLAGGYHDCGVWSRHDLDSDTPGDKRRQMCAAKVVYDAMGMAPWN